MTLLLLVLPLTEEPQQPEVVSCLWKHDSLGLRLPKTDLSHLDAGDRGTNFSDSSFPVGPSLCPFVDFPDSFHTSVTHILTLILVHCSLLYPLGVLSVPELPLCSGTGQLPLPGLCLAFRFVFFPHPAGSCPSMNPTPASWCVVSLNSGSI